MGITIRVTPRTIERAVFIIIILFFMGSTIYYSYNSGSCAVEDAQGNEQDKTQPEEGSGTTGAATAEPKKEEAIEEEASAAQEPAAEPAEEEKAATASTSYKDVEITIAPLKYTVKESASFTKAEVESIAFIIKNKMSKDLVNMQVEVYFWDLSSNEGFRTHPKDTLTFPTIKSGASTTQLLSVDNINLYNFDLTKTFKFVFLDKDGETINTMSTTLKVEE